mmetsp:Transcript_44614/g.95183  ORF Transcript_44614/g.95183 Transcript_44614/m.95183 type:complete len:327 (-) Transcript_44614:54-1034(-)
MLQQTRDGLGSLPFALPVAFPVLNAVAPGTVGIVSLARPNHLQIRSDSLRPTLFVLGTSLVAVLLRRPRSPVELLSELVGLVDLGVHGLLQIGALSNLGLGGRRELGTLEPNGFVLFVLVLEIPAQRLNQRPSVREALFTGHRLVIAPCETLLQLDNFAIAVASRGGADRELLAAHRVVVSDEYVTVIQALRELGLQLLHRSTAVIEFSLHALQGSQRSHLVPVDELGVGRVTGDDLTEDCQHQQLISRVGLNDRRLDDGCHHALELLHRGVHAGSDLPSALDFRLNGCKLALQSGQGGLLMGAHLHSDGSSSGEESNTHGWKCRG